MPPQLPPKISVPSAGLVNILSVINVCMESSTASLICGILMKGKRPDTKVIWQVDARIQEFLPFSLCLVCWTLPAVTTNLGEIDILKGEWCGKIALQKQFGRIHSL